MKKIPNVLILSSLLVLTMQVAHADDSYVDALSSEAGGTQMKADANAKVTDDDPEPAAGADSTANPDALATKVTSQLENLLSGKSGKEVKTEDVANVVSSAVKEGYDIDAIQGAVSSAMEELKKKEGVEIKPEVFKFVANAVKDIVGASKDVAQGDPNDPYIQSLNAEVDDLSIKGDGKKSDAKTAEAPSADGDKEAKTKTAEASTTDKANDSGKKSEETAETASDTPKDTSGSGRTIIVLQGDSLSRIAAKIYGSGRYYTVLFDANRDKLSNPDSIDIGQVLTIPPLPKSSE